MSDIHTWVLIAVIALVTVLLRFLPFIVFSDSGKNPENHREAE